MLDRDEPDLHAIQLALHGRALLERCPAEALKTNALRALTVLAPAR